MVVLFLQVTTEIQCSCHHEDISNMSIKLSCFDTAHTYTFYAQCTLDNFTDILPMK